MLKTQGNEKTRLFGEIEQLVEIVVEGTTYKVPKDLELLRCFQYLEFKIAFENFCWNASCENCAANVKLPGKAYERTLCCQEASVEGLEVEKLPDGIEK